MRTVNGVYFIRLTDMTHMRNNYNINHINRNQTSYIVLLDTAYYRKTSCVSRTLVGN